MFLNYLKIHIFKSSLFSQWISIFFYLPINVSLNTLSLGSLLTIFNATINTTFFLTFRYYRSDVGILQPMSLIRLFRCPCQREQDGVSGECWRGVAHPCRQGMDRDRAGVGGMEWQGGWDGRGGGSLPEQSQFLMWLLGKNYCPSLL